MSQLFASGGRSIRASAAASVLSMNVQGWFPLGWTGLVSLLPRGSQGSSPGLQLEGINLTLSLSHGLTLKSVPDYRETIVMII